MRTGYSLLAALALAAPATAAPTGAELYAKHCVRCHGKAGEGTKRHEIPLEGDKSVNQLADVIDRTMPEGDPDKLGAAESKLVAAHIYEAFYSPDARARNKPPRVELS